MLDFFKIFILYASKWRKDKSIKHGFIKLILFIVCGIILNLSLPFILKFYILQASSEFFIAPSFIILFYCFLFVLNKIIASLSGYFVGNLVSKIACLINLDFVTQVLELDRSKYNISDIGGITNTLSKAQTALPAILSSLTIIVIPLTIEFTIFAIIVLNLYGLNFCIYFILMILLFFIISLQFSKKLNQNLIYSNKLQNKSTSCLVNILCNYETISYFSTKFQEINKYSNYHKHRAKNDFQYNYWMFINQVIKQLIFCSVFTIILYCIASNILLQKHQIANLVFVNSFLLQLFQPLFNLDSIFRNLNKALLDFKELLSILVASNTHVQNTYVQNTHIDKEEILSFKNVSFNFNVSEKIFEKINFDIKKGDRILFISPSGSGKSTLIKLIYRLFKVNSGHITISGNDINTMQQSEIVSNIGVVPQEITFFDTSILKNVTYGASKIDYSKLEKSLNSAFCRDFLKNLPDGYNTIIGPNGVLLSGGQRQRLAIARIFYHNPNLYIFDESLSAIDDICKNVIINSINNLDVLKAVIFITHTKPKNMIFNKVVTIDNKKIRVIKS